MKKFTGAATISCAVIALALTACAPQSNENGARIGRRCEGDPDHGCVVGGLGVWHLPCDPEQASYDDAACVASTHEGQACISCPC